jgi:pimeloyl-ACP methyl ester carboxylesterase
VSCEKTGYKIFDRYKEHGLAGKTLAAALPNSRTVVLPGAGHMMMVGRPDELLVALQG